MKRHSTGLKATLINIFRSKVVQWALVASITFWPVSEFIEYKFFRNNEVQRDEEIKASSDSSDVKGTINTDVIKGEDDTTTSKYNLEDNYSEYEENGGGSNDVSISTSTIDMSSLNGNEVTISEGENFEPIKDLKLSATDRDGSNISDRIVVEKNPVNVEKPGVYYVDVSAKQNNGYKMHRQFRVNVKATNSIVTVDSFEAIDNEVEKGEKVILGLSLQSSKKHARVIAATINGKEYSVFKAQGKISSALSNTQKYRIEIGAGSVAGVNDYRLSHIKMSDGTLVDVNKSSKVQVLKTEPKIENFKSKVENEKKKIDIRFRVKDSDEAIKSLKAELYRDNELIYSKKLDSSIDQNINIDIEKNGDYKVRLVANVNLYTEDKEGLKDFEKELYSKIITVNKIDESSLFGEDIELNTGEDFDIKRDLNLKATDVNGEDITNKIVVEQNTVNTNEPGVYKVAVYVLNKNNERIAKEFIVTVIGDPIKENKGNTEDINEEGVLKTRSIFGFKKNKVTNAKSTTETVIGEDNVNANITVKGIVSGDDGSLPAGRIHVEVPTSAMFMVNKEGHLSSEPIQIKNKGDLPVEVYVDAFFDGNPNGGITVHPFRTDINEMDRSNIHLYLKGSEEKDLGDKTISKTPLLEVAANNTGYLQLMGKAGKSSEKVINEGISENFQLILKIKKKE